MLQLRVQTTLCIALGLLAWTACDDLECGEGTEAFDGRCVSVSDAGADGSVNQPDGSTGKEPVTCSGDTRLVDRKCVAKKAVGADCKANAECLSNFCVPEMEGLPGGMCTVLGCSAENACPSGSTCYQRDKTTALCLPFCDRAAECRESEGYHCQPIWGSALNFCAPSCALTKSCSAGTQCNEESGLCELAECQVGASEGCDESEICWPDSKGLSTKGGLCLHECEVAAPEKACKVQQNEVCQPLADDPTKGICAPPVCTMNAQCPAGAECANNVCQPPAACDEETQCPDERTCVSGKCMRKCPTDETKCSDTHPDLVCADVLAVPACLPLGSYPGSACKQAETDKCGELTVGSAKVPMVCQNDACLADCTTGGDALCSGLSATLECAKGIFEKDLCLPKGSFPGSGCGPNNTCAQDLNGDSAIDMQCVEGTCVIGCSETTKWAGYGDALCSLVDQSLTCATKAGAICVPACNEAGECAPNYSCLDAGAIPTHENACLPTGSFPGSPCRQQSGDQCDVDVGGNEAVDMVCSNNTCTVSCPNNNDALCAGVDSRLTCSESAGNLCVFACVSGACPTGYSCLDPGDSTHQNACLPNGTFPGSTCRSEEGNACDQNVGGNAAVDMACVSNTCVVTCPGNDEAANDALCGAVNSALTCAESAGHLCLPVGTFPGSPCRSDPENQCDQNLGGNAAVDMACVSNTCVVQCNTGDENGNDALCGAVNSALTCSESGGHLCVPKCVSGMCPTGFSCLDAGDSTHQNACLPNGTFPGSKCRTSGTVCDQNLGGQPSFDMTCISTTCYLQCANDNDALCSTYNAELTCYAAANICVPACVAGNCPDSLSCNDENACVAP